MDRYLIKRKPDPDGSNTRADDQNSPGCSKLPKVHQIKQNKEIKSSKPKISTQSAEANSETNKSNTENEKRNIEYVDKDKNCEDKNEDEDKMEEDEDKIEKNNDKKEKKVASKNRKQVFNDKWLEVTEFQGWLISKEHNGLVLPMCKFCQIILSNHRPNIQRHAATAKHLSLATAALSTPSIKKVIAQKDPVEKMVRRAEIKIAGLLAVNNLPFSLCDSLVPLISDIVPDSKIAQKLSMGRTIATTIVKDLIGPHFENRLNDTLREPGNYFSLIMDETTDQSSKKQCAVTAICFIENKLTTNFLTMVEVAEGSAKSLFAVLSDTLKERNIPIENFVGFSSDTTNSMVGEHNSVFSHLKEAVPHILCIKCSCHMIHLASSYACLKLPKSVEDMLRNIGAHFGRSHGRQKKLEEVQQFFEIDIHKILSPATTRWLSLKQCVDRVLEQYPALQEYFRVEVFEDPSRTTESILMTLNNKFTKLYLEFMSYTLELLNDFNVLFQSETPLLHRLKPETEKMIKTLASNYLHFDYCKQTSALHINPSNPRNFLELNKVYVGVLAQSTLAELKSNINNAEEMKDFDMKIETFKKDCINFYIEVIIQIKKRFSFTDPIFDIIKVLEPSVAKSFELKDLTNVFERFPNLRNSTKETDVHKEWRDHAMLDHENIGLYSALEPLHYWKKVFELKNAIGETRFQNLKKIIQLLLVLPFSNASVERVFSKLKLTKTETRNKLNTDTLSALMHASDGINLQGGIKKYEPTQNLLQKKISYKNKQ